MRASPGFLTKTTYLLMAGGVLGLWPVIGQTADPPNPIQVKPLLKKVGVDTPAKTGDLAVSFQFRNKPWSQVMEWLGEISGLPVVTPILPTGSFTFIPQKEKTYNLAQIVDILNEGLVPQNYILIRREQSFTVISADKDIDPGIVPRLSEEELNERGNTEIVSIVVTLKSLNAEEFAPVIKKTMGPFGSAVGLPSPINQLVLQDQVKTLRRVLKTIHDNEASDKGQAESFTYTCRYIKARDAEQLLQGLLGNPADIQRLQQPSGGFRDRYIQDVGGGIPGGINMQRIPTPAPAAQQQPALKLKPHYIKSDDRTNTVMINGPVEIIARAKTFLNSIDVEQPGSKPIIIGTPTFKVHNVPAGTADALATTLKGIYKESNNLRISTSGNNKIIVYACPDDQESILLQILKFSENGPKTTLIPLASMEASKAVDHLKGLFGDSTKGGPIIDAETNRNAVLVRGTPEQIDDIKEALKELGETGELTGNMRVIPINQGSAALLAEALKRHLSEMRPDTPVKVIIPGRGDIVPPKKKSPNGSDEPASKKKILDGSEEQEEKPVRSRNTRQLVDPQDKKGAPDKGSKDKPITITVVGNRLIIESEDPKARELVQDLARILTQTPSEKGDFEIIRLKNASAIDLAKVLDEAFNGTKQQPNQQNPFGIPFIVGGRSSANTPPAEPKVRIVADPKTNSLLVRASPVDMATIRSWLENALDTGEAEGQKSFIVGPLKFASATEVAALVRDVYREFINNNPANSSSSSGFGGFPFGGRRSTFVNQNLDANGNPRGVSLSVGVDDRSNSLVVMCSSAMHDEIKILAAELDKAAESSTRTVRLVSIKNVDPVLVQQAIEAIQGRTSGQRNNSQTPGFVPFGTGGVIPGSGYPGGGSRYRGSGGYTPGGGGTVFPSGGGGPGGRGPSSMLPNNRGPDFFEQRVKDDPRLTVLYDPQLDTSATDELISSHPSSSDRVGLGFHDHETNAAPGKTSSNRVGLGFKGLDNEGPAVWVVQPKPNSKPGSLQLVRYEEQQAQPTQPPQPPGPEGGPIRGPRSPVTAEALEQLGVIIITGNNQADVAEIENIIKTIIQLGAGAEFNFELVPLLNADATSVATTLTQAFSRVQIGTTANYPTRATGTGTSGITPSPIGAPPTTPTQAQGQSSVVLLPIPRLNAILVAAPKARMEYVKKEIKQLDRGSSPPGKAVYIPLKKASAIRVATLLTNFFASRYPIETTAQNQIRITQDESTNTLIVQAAPADLAEIKDLVEQIETTVSQAVNELRIVPLKNVTSDEMAALLSQIITQGIVAPATTTGAPTPGLPTPGGPVPGGPPRPPTTTQPTATGPGVATKTTSVKLVVKGKNGGKVLESGLLEDVHIASSPRINSLIISAPEKSMELLENLIKELDVLPPLRADVKIFQFKRADATAMANIIQQLFLGTGTTTPGGPTPGGPTGGPTPTPTTPGPTGTQATAPRTMAPIGLAGVEGGPLVDLRISVDLRTNSLVVAGSPSDIFMIDAIISRLEDAEVEIRRNEVYHLRNSAAADVATALNSYLTGALAVYSKSAQLTPFQDVEREVVVVPEPISNKLLISATPFYFDEIIRLVKAIDAEPPQVMIQVLIAEVDLNNTEEFGVEIGLQSPILFQRGIIPAPGFLNSGSISFAPPAMGTGLVPPGVTVSSTINPTAVPGFDFNTTNPLGNNPVVGPGIVGFQGLGNLGVGRVSPTSGVGGFVFSAGNDAFNLLIRALNTQGRMEILSRPQLMTMDNQTATIQIGQDVPYNNSTVTATGIISNSPVYRSVGVLLNVTPKISPDGKVLMRVNPTIASVAPVQESLGGGVTAPIFNTQNVETTVLAYDGETVAIGGLITKLDNKSENKIPWFGDLPCVGALFRYRTQIKRKVELLVILTPHILRNRIEREMILAEEGRKLECNLVEHILKIHGESGMEPLMPALSKGSTACPPGGPGGLMQTLPGPTIPEPRKGEKLPAPRPDGNNPNPPAPRPDGNNPNPPAPRPDGNNPNPPAIQNPPGETSALPGPGLAPLQQTSWPFYPDARLQQTPVFYPPLRGNGMSAPNENGMENGKWNFPKNMSENNNTGEANRKP